MGVAGARFRGSARRLATVTRMRSLIERDHAAVWHPYTQMKTAGDPLPIVRGEGCYLITEDGRRIFDGISSWWTILHGHRHPRLMAALGRAAALERQSPAGAGR